MKIFIEKTGKETKLSFEGTVASLLRKININHEEVIVVRNQELLSEDEKLSDEDDIKILSVVSGG